MLELSIVITDDKLIQTGDVLTCVANEINQYIPFTIGRDRNGYRCFICSIVDDNKNVEHVDEIKNEIKIVEHVDEIKNETKNETKNVEHVDETKNETKNETKEQIRLKDYDDLYTYETIPNKLKYLKKEINSHSSITNLVILDLAYTKSIYLNDIDFQETAHPTPSLKMSNYRNLLEKGLDETYYCSPDRKIFWITKEMESILLRHFDNIKDIYAFKLSFDDVSFDGFSDDCGYDAPDYMRKHKWDSYSDIKWKQMYCITKNCSLRLTSAYDDDDKNKLADFTFYIHETPSKRFFIIFDYFKQQAYLLHQRTSQVQTFEYINDGATLELTELMFVHDNDDCVRLFKRQDSLNIHEDQAVCEEMEDMKVYSLGFNTFTDDEDEPFFDYVEEFYVESKREIDQLKEQIKEANSKIDDLKKDLRILRVARK